MSKISSAGRRRRGGREIVVKIDTRFRGRQWVAISRQACAGPPAFGGEGGDQMEDVIDGSWRRRGWLRFSPARPCLIEQEDYIISYQYSRFMA